MTLKLRRATGANTRPPSSTIRTLRARAAPRGVAEDDARGARASRPGHGGPRDAMPPRRAPPARVDPTHARTPPDEGTLASSAVRNVNALLEKRASRRAAATAAAAATTAAASPAAASLASASVWAFLGALSRRATVGSKKHPP